MINGFEDEGVGSSSISITSTKWSVFFKCLNPRYTYCLVVDSYHNVFAVSKVTMDPVVYCKSDIDLDHRWDPGEKGIGLEYCPRLLTGHGRP